MTDEPSVAASEDTPTAPAAKPLISQVIDETVRRLIASHALPKAAIAEIERLLSSDSPPSADDLRSAVDIEDPEDEAA